MAKTGVKKNTDYNSLNSSYFCSFHNNYTCLNLTNKNIFIGISLGSICRFPKRIIRKYCQFLQNKASHFLIIIADQLESFNYQSFLGLDENKSNQRARRIGNQYLMGYKKISQDYDFCSVKLLSDFFNTSCIQTVNNTLLQEYDQNITFRNQVYHQIRLNLTREFSNKTYQIDLLSRYLLGEYSVCIALYQDFLLEQPIQISTQPDFLLLDIFNGCYPNLTKILNLNSDLFKYIVIDFQEEKT